MTKAQRDALKWLVEHGGNGVFDRYLRLVAAGEFARVNKATWNALRDLGKVEYYRVPGTKTGTGGVGTRVRIIEENKK